MINIEIKCDCCGKRSGQFTPINSEKTLKKVCQDEGVISDFSQHYFSLSEDICFDCFKSKTDVFRFKNQYIDLNAV